MKTLVVTADDKLGWAMLARLPQRRDVITAFDASPALPRVVRLIRRGSLSLRLVRRMVWAEWRRPWRRVLADHRIKGNRELLEVIRCENICWVVLYRASLIVNRDVLNSGAEVLNIHCARIPDFGGLGSIQRALDLQALNQVACLHRVTERIDDGEVVASEPYLLSSTRGYRANEDEAYAAGTRLLLRWLAEKSK